MLIIFTIGLTHLLKKYKRNKLCPLREQKDWNIEFGAIWLKKKTATHIEANIYKSESVNLSSCEIEFWSHLFMCSDFALLNIFTDTTILQLNVLMVYNDTFLLMKFIERHFFLLAYQCLDVLFWLKMKPCALFLNFCLHYSYCIFKTNTNWIVF